MKRLLHGLIRIYPSAWRNRYGVEFQALLDDADPRWSDLADILKGAIVMRMTTGTTAGAFALSGALLCGIVSYTLLPAEFASSVRFTLPQTTANEQINDAAELALSRHSLQSIIEKEGLYEQDRAKLPLEDVIESMKKRVRISPVPGQGQDRAVELQFVYGDARKAQAATGDLLAKLTEQQPGLRPMNLPSLPLTPSGPSHAAIIACGLAGGALLGMLASRFRRRSA